MKDRRFQVHGILEAPPIVVAHLDRLDVGMEGKQEVWVRTEGARPEGIVNCRNFALRGSAYL
jgi:hypothetical protein